MKGLLCGEGNGGLGGYACKGKDDVTMMWGSSFVSEAFKTLACSTFSLATLVQQSSI
jgi:hypothetical protein